MYIKAAPKIDRATMKNLTLKAGQIMKMDVKVSGEPPATKKWFIGTDSLENRSDIVIELEDYRTKISVTNIQRVHGGHYTLKAENSSGSDEASIEIMVLDKPTKPEGPLTISDVHKEGCNLKWNNPLDDGGTPIEYFVVEKFSPETGRWIQVGKTREPKMEVSNLTPNQKYKFRVMAVNSEGESEPLNAEQSIIAKNPFGKRVFFLKIKLKKNMYFFHQKFYFR